MRRYVTLGALLAGGVLVTAGLSGGSKAFTQTGPPDADTSRRNAIVAAAERASPAVVSVGTMADVVYGHIQGNTIIPHIEQEAVPYLGSGVIIDGEQGLVITNGHVIRGANQLIVTLPDGRQLDAELVGSDMTNDLALLRVDESGLPQIPWGHSSDILIGEWALAIGNPFGNFIDSPQPTVTVGVVSALHRDFRDSQSGRVYLDMVQTDASINPGNSGGALVNAHGELIGINTFIISTSGSSADIGFAIPVDRIHRVVDEILAHGRVRSVYQDFHTQTFRQRMAQSLGREHTPGAIVWEIDTNGPAAQAGLENGDVITRINNRPVTTSQELEDYLFTFRVGEPIQLTVQRESGQAEIAYELVEDRR